MMDPTGASSPSARAIAAALDARLRDVGGFKVRRLLPSRARRLVGPFIFFDHMGPATLREDEAVDIPPHPHIGLATVTYLLEGALVHRDSLGSVQEIRPGEINWMTAGRGIVHSERTPAELRKRNSKVHGLQIWVALPTALEESSPEFRHYPKESIPQTQRAGADIHVLAGKAYGLQSPVETLSPLFYVDIALDGTSELPIPDDYEERAAYVVEGAVSCATERAGAGRMLVFAPGVRVVLRAESHSRVVLLGGAPIGGKRHIWWNFVSSSQRRIEQAKDDWKSGRFPKVPGDEIEFIPLAE